MHDLLRHVATPWRSASPPHLACYFLEQPDLCRLKRDDDKMRAAKPLYLKWGDLGCWACSYTVAAALSRFGADPIYGQSSRVNKYVHVEYLNKDISIEDVWRVIAHHYGVRRIPQLNIHQAVLLAARCWVDFQDVEPPSPRLTYQCAAKLYGIDFDIMGGRGSFRRVTKFFRVVDQRFAHFPDANRQWIPHYLRPIWDGHVGVAPAIDFTLSLLDNTDANTVPLTSSEAAIVVPHPSMEPGSIQIKQGETSQTNPYEALCKLAKKKNIPASDIISATLQFMTLEHQRSRGDFLRGLQSLLTDFS